MFTTTLVMDEPVGEEFLDLVLGDRDLINLAFRTTVQDEWPQL
ncbi:MAG: hypothetical protein JWO98_5476 [Frankiales bacterium]|nr:hypothetical protein [Frankiales bacterium]